MNSSYNRSVYQLATAVQQNLSFPAVYHSIGLCHYQVIVYQLGNYRLIRGEIQHVDNCNLAYITFCLLGEKTVMLSFTALAPIYRPLLVSSVVQQITPSATINQFL
jgi:hypothetical protein